MGLFDFMNPITQGARSYANSLNQPVPQRGGFGFGGGGGFNLGGMFGNFRDTLARGQNARQRFGYDLNPFDTRQYSLPSQMQNPFSPLTATMFEPKPDPGFRPIHGPIRPEQDIQMALRRFQDQRIPMDRGYVKGRNSVTRNRMAGRTKY